VYYETIKKFNGNAEQMFPRLIFEIVKAYTAKGWKVEKVKMRVSSEEVLALKFS
jgi:hypothetical protein